MKKIVSILLVVMMISTFFVGCSSNKASEDGNGKKNDVTDNTDGDSDKKDEITEITFMCLPAWATALETVVEEYKNETGVKVNIESYPFGELMDAIEVKIGSGSKDYDVFLVDGPNVAAYVKRGYIVSLEDVITTEERAQYNPPLIAQSTWDNTFYAAPVFDSSQMLYYNTALLAEAGITIPENDAENRLTYEQIADIAKKVQDTLDADGSRGIFGAEFQQVGRTYQMNMLANSKGGLNIGTDGYTVEGVLNGPEWMEALTWYQEQVNAGIFTKGIAPNEVNSYFYSGKMVFEIAGGDLVRTCLDNEFSDYEYTYAPAFEGYEEFAATPCGSWAVGINAASVKQEAAAEFVRYISLGKGNDVLVDLVGDLPARSALYDNIPEGKEHYTIAKYELTNSGVVRAVTPGFSEYNTVIASMWENIRNGSDVASTVEGAISDINRAMEVHKQ
ncbi:MAG TPA: extracellular solute-binding protein [Mobilitalea sp.]|nr:extracellular solute-binding protein [Mobilitalea sp.]